MNCEQLVTIPQTAFSLAQRFVGVQEGPGAANNPQVLAMLRMDTKWPTGDHVPWCSAFCNYTCWLLRLPRSKNLRARSWLSVGRAIRVEDAQVGFDVVILQRGAGKQPGPENTTAPGHVGFFAGRNHHETVMVLGGNQRNAVTVAPYPVSRILGVRRIYG